MCLTLLLFASKTIAHHSSFAVSNQSFRYSLIESFLIEFLIIFTSGVSLGFYFIYLVLISAVPTRQSSAVSKLDQPRSVLGSVLSWEITTYRDVDTTIG